MFYFLGLSSLGFSLLRPYRCYSHCVNLLFGFVEVVEGRTFTLKTCQAAASSSQRLVICPTRPGSLPWAAGYAEVDTPKTSNVHVPLQRKHVQVDRSSIMLQHCLAVLAYEGSLSQK